VDLEQVDPVLVHLLLEEQEAKQAKVVRAASKPSKLST
jgi:hypothetical protein